MKPIYVLNLNLNKLNRIFVPIPKLVNITRRLYQTRIQNEKFQVKGFKVLHKQTVGLNYYFVYTF